MAYCIGNLKQITIATILSAVDQEEFPIALTTTSQGGGSTDATISEYYDHQMAITQCPNVTGKVTDTPSVFSYGINQLIRGVNLGKVLYASQIIILGESFNESVLANIDHVTYRHLHSSLMGFADGHVESVVPAQLVNALENYLGSSPVSPEGFGILRVPGPYIEFEPAIIPFDFAQNSVCSNGFQWDFLGLTDNGDGTSTFNFNLTNYNSHNMNYTVFELPPGVSAVSPADGSTYVGTTDTYHVANTTENPFHSIKFHKTGRAIRNGASDMFEFTLNNSDIALIQSMRVSAKSSAKVGQGQFDKGEPGTADGGCTN